MRNEMRKVAKDTKNKDLFKLGDKYRQILLDDFNIKIEDATNVWKRVNKR